MRDLLAEQGRFPKVTHLGVAPSRAGRTLLDSRAPIVYVALEETVPSETTFVLKPDALFLESPPHSEVGLRAGLLDRQIIDIEGARVVRVNDVWLAESAAGMRVVGAEVGIAGIFRRLGLERAVRRLAEPLGLEILEKLIPWTYIAPLEEAMGRVQLTVPAHQLRNLHPGELADILDGLDPDQRERILGLLTDHRIAEILAETDPEVSRAAVEALGEDRMRRVLEIMPPDEATDLLGALGYEKSERLLSLIGLGQAEILRELLGFPPDTAGGRMTTSFLAIGREATATDAIEHIRAEAARAETVYYAYVLDAQARLAGVLSFRDLLRADPSRVVSDLIDKNPVSVHVMDDQQDVARKMARYDLLALPVVDDAGKLRGIVTVDDILQVLEEEASEDLAEVAGVYLGEGPGVRAGRVTGFLFSVIGGASAAALLESKRPVLASIAAVAWLLPLYLRIAQDLGTWSLARALAGLSLPLRKRLDSLAYELLAALATAAAAAVLVATFGTWWTGEFTAGAFLGVGIFVGALAASIIGLALPSVASSLRLSRLLARGRPLAVLVGLATVLVYVWSLSSLASRLG